MTSYIEMNFDGLVGPTHNYGGLSLGNIASEMHKNQVSNPKAAALQGLEKMKLLHDLGIAQAVLPPHERPYLPILRTLGFSGNVESIMAQCAKSLPEYIPFVMSASSMWTANAATVVPSCDALDKKLHITPANLISKLHRSIEPAFTYRVFNKIFDDPTYFRVHKPLPPFKHFADEGAANHMRLAKDHSSPGLHLFIYGFRAFQPNVVLPTHYAPRQAFEASQAIARLQHLAPEKVIFVQQDPKAIDAGVFHNDVIATSNGHLLLYHKNAYVGGEAVIDGIRQKLAEHCYADLHAIEIPEHLLTVNDAVSTYLFNSQIVTLPSGKMAWIAPSQCEENVHSKSIIESILANDSSPIQSIYYLDLLQSMQNGGGPACLRLRINLNEAELAAMHKGIRFTPILYRQLKDWIQKHYRDRLTPHDLTDPNLFQEIHTALDELTQILEIGPLYSFQQGI